MEFNPKANERILHLQEQAAGQGDVVALHRQVQRRAPRLPLLGVDVRPRAQQQQQTLHAVAHHGDVDGVETCGPSTGTVRAGRLLTEGLPVVFAGALSQ